MITYSIIQKSQLEGVHRLDAEYYQPEYLESQFVLNRLNTCFLSDICKITDGNHSIISGWFTDSGVRYLRGQDLADFFISNENPVYISEHIYQKLKRSHIFQEDVLLSIVGTIGMVSIVADPFEKLTSNCKIAILHSKEINPWFLAIFLASIYGQHQIQRKVAGAVQTGIILKDLSNISVPVLSDHKQGQIQDIAKRAYQNHLVSRSLYSQAKNLLLEKIGLKDFEVKDDLFYIFNLADVKSVHRADAEYWQPKYKKLLSYLKKKFEIKRLGDLVSVKKGIEPGSGRYQEEGKPFIRVSNLSKFGINDNDQKYLTYDFYQDLKRNYQPKMGEILLSKDATPGIAYAVKESIEGIIAGGILRLRVETDLEPEYLALIINSPIGQYQMERDTGGSVIIHWRPEQIRNICIPIIEKPTQQKIASLVRQSHEARKKSKNLLEEAKQKVEKMILGKIR